MDGSKLTKEFQVVFISENLRELKVFVFWISAGVIAIKEATEWLSANILSVRKVNIYRLR